MNGFDQSAIDLAGLVAARLCHDLANPIGAIGNGIDLMRELGTGPAEDLALVGNAQSQAAAVLAFHRLALGPASTDGTAVAWSELQARAEAALGSARVQLVWEGVDGGLLTRPAVRLAALMMMAGRALLGLEGRIVAALPARAPWLLEVRAEGPRAAWTDDLRAILGGVVPEPRRVEFALLGPAAAAAGARIETIEAGGVAGLRALAV